MSKRKGPTDDNPNGDFVEFLMGRPKLRSKDKAMTL